MPSENGILAKLTSLRQGFLTGVEQARSQFVSSIKALREDYVTQVVDVTMSDPKLSDVEKALGSWSTQPTAAAPVVPPPPAEPATTGMVAIGQSHAPEKFPMKTIRGLTVYGRCPNCDSYVLEPQAKFCSHCAYPLEGEV